MATNTVGLIDYGVGNLGSVRNMFKRIGVPTQDVNDPKQMTNYGRVLLPGVGSFDHGMRSLKLGNWIDAIENYVSSGNFLLGICLGMQLLLNSSQEGEESGLGFIPGRSTRFDDTGGLQVPHMGWNFVEPARQSPLIRELEHNARYYFVHSYYVTTDRPEHSIGKTTYGVEFSSVISNENVMGTQFHPEKSHIFGMQLLKNFSEL